MTAARHIPPSKSLILSSNKICQRGDFMKLLVMLLALIPLHDYQSEDADINPYLKLKHALSN
jgi:hypothetical protein